MNTVFPNRILPYLLLAAVLAGLCGVPACRKRFFPPREERLLRAFYRRVERDCGQKVERGRVGLFELADLTGNQHVQEFADVYAGVVYRDKKLTDDEYRRLSRMILKGFRSAA